MDISFLSEGILFILFGIAGIFTSHQALFKRRLYWIYPTISGFKNRKKDLDGTGLSWFLGFQALLLSIASLFFCV